MQDAYQVKVAQQEHLKAELAKYQETMQSLPPDQRAAMMQQIYTRVQAEQQAMNAHQDCDKPGCCNLPAPRNSDPKAGTSSSVMSEAEQMAFFSSLQPPRP